METEPDDLDLDELGDDAAAAYLSRKLREARELQQLATRAAIEAQIAGDRVASLRRAGREPREGSSRGR